MSLVQYQVASQSTTCYSPPIWLNDSNRFFLEYQLSIQLPSLCFAVSDNITLASYRLIGINGNLTPAWQTLDFHSLAACQYLYALMSCLPPASHRFSSCICPLVHPSNWHSYYYHWVLDVLPRVLSATLFQSTTGSEVTLIVPRLSQPWLLQSLYCLNADHPISLINISRRITSISSDHLLMAPGARISANSTFSLSASHILPTGLVHPVLVNQLSGLIVNSVHSNNPNLSPSGLPKRVFISRSDSSYRRILNEAEILNLLLPHGFTRIELSQLDFSTQVSIFDNVEIVIGPHGAGLTNLIFAKHAFVLEIFASGHGVRPDFYQLANIRKCKYYAILEPSVNSSNDIVVSSAAVQAFLAQVL